MEPPNVPPNSGPNTQPMSEYYKRIVATAQRKRNHTESLRLATDAVCEKILRDFQNNIEVAAKNFHDYAFIFIYDRRALFRGSVTYHSIISPSETALENYRSAKVRTVLECLRDLLAPFQVQLGVLHGTPDDERSVWGITVHWEVTDAEPPLPSPEETSPALIPSASLAPESVTSKEHKDSMDSLGEHEISESH